MSVIDSLFVTKYTKDGSYSPIPLTEWTSQFLADIERLFGQRDHSFTLVGIDIDKTPDNPPMIWFPNSGIATGGVERRSKHIVIRLNKNALTDPIRARWQLAHECVHLLDPWCPKIEGRTANVLEEVLATWFQNDRVSEAACHEEPYATAEKLVKPLIPKLTEAVKRIRVYRKKRIGEITHDVLCADYPELTRDISAELCQPFWVEES